jgi:hypothetical protein
MPAYSNHTTNGVLVAIGMGNEKKKKACTENNNKKECMRTYQGVGSDQKKIIYVQRKKNDKGHGTFPKKKKKKKMQSRKVE